MKNQEEYWNDKIENGPNAELYNNLLKLKTEEDYFTDQEFTLAVNPLFFGLGYLQKLIDFYIYNKAENKSFSWGTEEDRKKRLQELISGEFSLPHNGQDLLKNIQLIWDNNIFKDIEAQSGGCLIMAEAIGLAYYPIIESLEEIKKKIAILIKEKKI